MKKTGRVEYVPHEICLEIDRLKATKNINKRADAFREILKYSKIGMGINSFDTKIKPKKLKNKHTFYESEFF